MSVGIRIKLLAPMVGTSFLIASVLTSYLTARRIAGLRSSEGPRGTWVMELTTGPANATRTQLIRAAMSIGSGALLLGILLAWGIARSLARRVEDIAHAASAVLTATSNELWL